MVKLTMKAARINTGLYQKEAAKRLGITAPMLSWLESGEVFPNEKLQKKMSKLYGLNIDAIDFHAE